MLISRVVVAFRALVLLRVVGLTALVVLGGCSAAARERHLVYDMDLPSGGHADPVDADHVHLLDVQDGPIIMLTTSTGRIAIFISGRASIDSSGLRRLDELVGAGEPVDHVVLLDLDYSRSLLLDAIMVRYKVKNIVAQDRCSLPEYLRGAHSRFSEISVFRTAPSVEASFEMGEGCEFRVSQMGASRTSAPLPVLARMRSHSLAITSLGSAWNDEKASIRIEMFPDSRVVNQARAKLVAGDGEAIVFPLLQAQVGEEKVPGVAIDAYILMPHRLDAKLELRFLRWILY